MQLESEEGLFLIISPAEKAVVRKDEEFKGARAGEILFNGQIGSIAGIPVVVSKAATAPVLATKEAVTLFVKKENEVEKTIREINPLEMSPMEALTLLYNLNKDLKDKK